MSHIMIILGCLATVNTGQKRPIQIYCKILYTGLDNNCSIFGHDQSKGISTGHGTLSNPRSRFKQLIQDWLLLSLEFQDTHVTRILYL